LSCLSALLALAAGCAAATVKPSADSEALTELRRQLDAQSAVVAQQQRRIEELEVKLAALEARARPQAPAAVPARSPLPATPRVDPRPSLKTIQGKHAEAETDFLAFVAAYPQHTAADNALYLAGLVRESRGDCASALPLFESVPLKYPAGDALPQALLERGRCLRILGRKDESKAILMQLQREHPEAAETAQGKLLLQE
jgi:TolA-binding protein